MPRFSLLILAACIGMVSGRAFAVPQVDPLLPQAPVFVPGVEMPAREQELLAIFDSASKKFGSSRTVAQKTDAVLTMENRIAAYMGRSIEAVDWVGRIKTTHSTPEGDIWIAIEIAPGIVLSTFQSRVADAADLTLIRRYSPMWESADMLTIGQPVAFSATMLLFDVRDDESMVDRPHIVVRFKAIKPLDASQ